MIKALCDSLKADVTHCKVKIEIIPGKGCYQGKYKIPVIDYDSHVISKDTLDVIVPVCLDISAKESR